MSVVCAEESGHPGIFSFRALYNAYEACRKRKRNTVNALRFEAGLLDHLFELRTSLVNGSYRPTRSVCFVAGSPKLREIFAADFRDRVVHHLLVPELEKIFEPKFIHDSYACRRNKGNHAAVMRLRSFMGRVSKGGRIPAWFLQLDVRSFFMSIDKDILLGIIGRHVNDRTIMELCRRIVEHDCTGDYLYKGRPGLRALVPAHKSLFGVPPGKGLPIGNLTSQFFANVYLNELDQFVKHELKCRFYLRYVDDFIILHTSKEALLATKLRVEDFLRRRLKLSLKPEYSLKRVRVGADFLGYIVRPDYLLCRRRVVGNLKAKLADYRQRLVAHGAVGRDSYTHLNLREPGLCGLRQTMASYLGHFKHGACRKLVAGMFAGYPYLRDLFEFDADTFRLQARYEPPFTPRTLRAQYGWFLKTYPGFCLFFQVGRFFEFYGVQADRYGRLFGLQVQKGGRGMGPRCGIPVRMLKTLKSKARQARLSYLVVAERGYYRSGLKKRLITEKLVFAGLTELLN